MKHTAILMVFVFSACTSVKHSVFPVFGHGFQPGEKLMVAKFQQAPNDAFSEQATRHLVQAFERCGGVVAIPYDTVQDCLYSHLLSTSPIWHIDTKLMIQLWEATQARYLLVGKVLGKSGSNPPVSIASAYGNGQTEDIKENWTTFQFTLHDLAASQIILTSQTKVKARQYNYTQDDGDVVSLHAPTNLAGKALEEGIVKLTAACHCQPEGESRRTPNADTEP